MEKIQKVNLILTTIISVLTLISIIFGFFYFGTGIVKDVEFIKGQINKLPVSIEKAVGLHKESVDKDIINLKEIDRELKQQIKVLYNK